MFAAFCRKHRDPSKENIAFLEEFRFCPFFSLSLSSYLLSFAYSFYDLEIKQKYEFLELKFSPENKNE